MRSYIFTECERRLLEEWLKTGVENQLTLDLFTKIRRNIPQLRQDLELTLEVMNALRMKKRWRGRVREGSGFGSVLRLVESALTRARRERSTSNA